MFFLQKRVNLSFATNLSALHLHEMCRLKKGSPALKEENKAILNKMSFMLASFEIYRHLQLFDRREELEGSDVKVAINSQHASKPHSSLVFKLSRLQEAKPHIFEPTEFYRCKNSFIFKCIEFWLNKARLIPKLAMY